jgi:hypothetical protein
LRQYGTCPWRIRKSRRESVRFNRELKLLDMPDAKWTRYRNASGIDYAHPIAIHEQAALLDKAGIHAVRLRFDGRQRRGYKRVQFEEAVRDDFKPTSRGRLRLIVSDA